MKLRYLDPCYLGIDTGTYSEKTVDHRGLVGILLHARFKWILSEYWNETYRPLGEPLRIEVYSPMAITRKRRVECIWTNFDTSQYLTTERIKQMGKIDPALLIEQAEAQIRDLEAFIRGMRRVIAGASFTNTQAPRRGRKPAAKPAKKGRRYTEAEKKEMSKKVKAAWRRRKESGGQA